MPSLISDGTWGLVRRPPRWPIFYTIAVLAVMAMAFAVSVRRYGIFACPANEYARGYFLGYCQGGAYGDYDHGAFWFRLEPKVREAAAAADVLFIGNSRLQFGFSAPALEKWSAADGFRYYLLGFSHFENATFLEPLVRELSPKARVYVINLDDFFIETQSPPGNDVMRVADARERYVSKGLWQIPHRLICSRLSFLCGQEVSYYRSRSTGEWTVGGTRGLFPGPTGPDSPVDQETIAHQKAIAVKFIAGLRVDRRCLFMTYVPTAPDKRGTAQALAAALGFELISPQLEGLRTLDGSHLDRASAERFVSAFAEIGRSRFRECLEDPLASNTRSRG